ncbi:21905_t:CDS:10 [Entrophospora sp. SA101]|nr:21905_t:CDS:10 [Entrophospora sp. SA101]
MTTAAFLESNCPDLKLISRGKVRDLYEIDEKTLLFVATDRISAFDVIMKNGIPGKGKILTRISLFWFNYLKDIIPNHLITAEFSEMPDILQKYKDQLENRCLLVKKCKVLPVEAIVRGSAWEEYKRKGSICDIELSKNLKQCQNFDEPLYTPSTKAEIGHHGIIIADTKFEFGIDSDGQLILVDEVLTPDSSRFWPAESYSIDKTQESWEDLLWHPIYKAKAIKDYKSTHPMDLSFEAGDIIEVLGIENDDWLNGNCKNSKKFGSFPKIFVKQPLPSRPTTKRKESYSSVQSYDSYDRMSIFSSYDYEEADPLSNCTVVLYSDLQGDQLDLSVDEYARETPESNTHSIRSLSHYLTSVWDDPLYKLRAIFVWVADNITYDTESLYSGKRKSQNGKDILKSRKAVCAGYSELFNDLAVDSGLDTFRISGAAKGAGYTVGSPIVSAEYAHAWNCVKYNGEYLLIDCTWGAGVVEERKFKKNFNDFYFLASPNQFIYSHLPEQPKHQYIGPTITKPEFINLPYVKPSFFKYGLIFKHFYGCEIVIKNDMLCIELEQTKLLDESINFAVNLEWSNTRNKDLCFYQNFHMIGNNGGRVHKISFGCPNRGQGQLSMFLIPEGQTWGEMTASFKVKNQGSGLKNRQFVLKYDSPSFKFTIIRPITKILGYAKKSKFEIIIVKNNHNNRSKKDNPPNLLICDADFGKKVNLEPSTTDNDYCFEEGVVYYSADVVLNHKGIWRIGYESGPNSYGFLAEYEVK